jgi:hypothetical protein
LWLWFGRAWLGWDNEWLEAWVVVFGNRVALALVQGFVKVCQVLFCEAAGALFVAVAQMVDEITF